MGGTMGESRLDKRVQTRNNPRSRHKIRKGCMYDDREEFFDVPRGQAKIRNVCTKSSIWATEVHIGKSFLSDELWAVHSEEDVTLLELKPAKDRSNAAAALANFLKVSTWPKAARHLTAGGWAGAVSKTSTAPIEFVRMQMMMKGSPGLFNIIGQAWQRGGPGAFFTGNMTDIIRITPQKAIQLAAFDKYKSFFSRKDKITGKKMGPTAFQTSLSGAMAGVTSTVACFPLEVIRTRLACSTDYKNITDAMVQIFTKEGPGSFFKGVQPSLVGVIPYAAVNLGMYDGIRKYYQTRTGQERVPKSVALIAGSLSGICGATVTFPLEVVRRRMMMGAPYKNTAHALYTIATTEGYGALFKGCLLGWVKLAPAAGISFYCYESAKEFLQV